KITRKIDANNKATSYSYTQDERLLSVSSGTVTQTYGYIPAGVENAGKIERVSDGLKTTLYSYYPDGRLKKTVFDGVKTEYEYSVSNGIETKTVTDAENKRVTTVMNGHGKILRTLYESDGSEDLYEYDANGNMVKLTHKKGGTSYSYIYVYDAANRMTSVTYDNEQPVTYTYDGSGNIRTKTEGSIVTSYVYDNYSRITRTDAGASVMERLTYSDSCPSCCAGNQRIASEFIEGYGTITYGYTAEGWLETTVYSPYNLPQTVIQNEYDSVGNLKKVKLDGSYITEYSYDSVNFRQDRVYDLIGGGSGVYQVAYDQAGNKTSITYPNRNMMEYSYGQAYRLTKANGYLLKKSGEKELITKNEIMLRDAVGNIRQKAVNTGLINYEYDALYQLTGYQNAAAANISYGYDYRGNRETMLNAGVSTTYGLSNNNKTTSIVAGTTRVLEYDNRGNLFKKGLASFYWDYKNRLITSYAGGIDKFLYNNADRKIYREYGSLYDRRAVYYYYNNDKLICEKDHLGRMQKIYTHDNEGVLGMARHLYDQYGTLKSVQKMYYLFDDLGSVTAITSSTGMPLKYYHYDPFGNITNTKEDEFNIFTFV
ncbi:MAG TPA: hypothetical protein P5511_06385, partial [Candidatus Goldiibacteriota bacterium]|nr:hypothetical protein [Candidatus Goldiibacteriota bacterium]